MHKVLAIETSCDETSVSIVSNSGDFYEIHSNIVASQIEDHSKWGGVVPELAARKHLELLPFVLEQALEESKISIEEIDAIASTCLLYTSPSPRDATLSRMPSSA